MVLEFDHDAGGSACGRLRIEDANFVVYQLQIFDMRVIGNESSLQGHSQSIDGTISIAHLQSIDVGIVRGFVHVDGSDLDRSSDPEPDPPPDLTPNPDRR